MRRAFAIVAGFSAGFFAWRAYDRTDANTNIFEAMTVMLTPKNSEMRLSEAGLAAIAAREGFSATRYPDASGYSIGYGHFIKPTDAFSEPISEATARELLRRDADTAADAVRAYVTAPLFQNHFDALVSFVYNIGAGAFKRSTLLAELNVGDYEGAAAQFARWNISQGKTLAALTTRRADESRQFLA